MHPPLRIELPDQAHAESLHRLLQRFNVETLPVNGSFEVRVDLLDHNPEARVVDVLDTIDLWLLNAGVPFVRVHLDGSAYTLHAPQAPARV